MRNTCALVTLVALAGCNGTSGLPSFSAQAAARGATTASPIAHVIIVVQENRSFDNLFDCFKGTDASGVAKRAFSKARSTSTNG